MRRPGLMAVVALLVCAGAPARGDDLRATYGATLKELDHDVEVSVAGGLARMVVTRTFENSGDRPDEATLSIELPTGAVARSLRAHLGGRWYQGTLLAAEEADTVYQHLTTTGEAATRGPVLLRWQGAGVLELQAYPVPAGGRLRVEYSLEAPLCYTAGAYLVDYPVSVDHGVIAPALRARGGRVFTDVAAAAQTLGVDDPRAGCDPSAEHSTQDALAYLVFPAPAERPVASRYGRTAVVAELGLARVEVDAAAVLEPLPREAAVVFVIDASRSVSEHDLETQLRAARAYLRHLPDARFEIVLYRRRAERLFGHLVAAARAEPLLDGVHPSRLLRGNGSNLERGLASAAEALADQSGPTRIVAFTDDLRPRAFTAEAAARALDRAPKGTIVHVLRLGVSDGLWAFERDDEHDLAPLAASTGGIAAWLVGGDDDLATAAEALLGLVRPIQIDHLAIEVPGVSAEELAVPELLAEGQAFRRTVLAAGGDGPVVVRGRIWGRALEHRIEPDRDLSSRLPGLVFGTSLWSLLPEEELPALATAAGVVSPFTSYLARDPRAGPSGWPHGELYGTSGICGGGVTCSSSCSAPYGIGTIGSAAVIERVDRLAVLHALLADRARGCFVLHGDGVDDVLLEVETTLHEIVGVSVEGTTSTPLGECLADAVWELDLDDRFVAPHDRYALHLTRAELPADQ